MHWGFSNLKYVDIFRCHESKSHHVHIVVFRKQLSKAAVVTLTVIIVL